jgi:predicted transcriptional regulator
MERKVLKIKFEHWSNFKVRTKKELEEVVMGKGEFVHPDDVLFFDSAVSYQRIMSERKYTILAAIKNLKLTSVYHLAKSVDSDFANVKKDCETLEAVGFIYLEDSGDNRGTKIPKLVFDYSAIEVHMPNMVYSHDLGNAAA